MMPSLKKSATLDQTDNWRKDRRLRLHHGCIAHVVDMINRFGSEDRHVLCADGQVHTSIYQYILVQTCMYRHILNFFVFRFVAPVHIWIPSARTVPRLRSTACALSALVLPAGVQTTSLPMHIAASASTEEWLKSWKSWIELVTSCLKRMVC